MGNESHYLIESSIQADVTMVYLSICIGSHFPQSLPSFKSLPLCTQELFKVGQGTLSEDKRSVWDVNNSVAWVNGVRFISHIWLFSALNTFPSGWESVSVPFPFSASCFLSYPTLTWNSQPYTDTGTVYLCRVCIIYAVQLFALNLLCLLFLNLTHFLESCCLAAFLSRYLIQNRWPSPAAIFSSSLRFPELSFF